MPGTCVNPSLLWSQDAIIPALSLAGQTLMGQSVMVKSSEVAVPPALPLNTALSYAHESHKHVLVYSVTVLKSCEWPGATLLSCSERLDARVE